MKSIILALFCLQFAGLALAFETETECAAMNENRQKVLKPAKEKSKEPVKGIQQ